MEWDVSPGQPTAWDQGRMWNETLKPKLYSQYRVDDGVVIWL